MNIDSYYPRIDKNNFYLGLISQVSRDNVVLQVENLSLFNNRKIKQEILIPNTINFFVVIDSAYGIFLGEVYQSKVLGIDSLHKSKSDEKKITVFPEINIDIIGLLGNDEKFKLSGFKTVGITDKVYLANKILVKKYLASIEVNKYEGQKLLKNLAKIGNFDAEFMDLQPNTLFDRHLMAIGTTNSGKSTSALTILDRLLKLNKKVLIIDPTGEYKSAFSNKEIEKLTLGVDTFLSTKYVSEMEWIRLFGIEHNANQSSVLAEAIISLKFQFSQRVSEPLKKEGEKLSLIKGKLNEYVGKNSPFNLELLEEQVKNEAVKDRNGDYVKDGNLYNALLWLLQIISFYKEQTRLITFFREDSNKELFSKIDGFLSKRRKKSLYIDFSQIGVSENIGLVIIDLISNHILNKQREEIDPFVMYIDEVHRYTKSNYENASSLGSIAREGRKKGIFLFLTTQNPKDIPDVLLGQVGSLIIHRLTHPEELKVIQNLVKQKTLSQIQNLNQGEAILTSINLLQDIHLRFIKSSRNHKNDTPIL